MVIFWGHHWSRNVFFLLSTILLRITRITTSQVRVLSSQIKARTCCLSLTLFLRSISFTNFFSLARGLFQTQVLASLGVHMCLNCNTRLNVYEKCDDSRKKRESLLRIDRFVHSFCAMCASTPFFLFFS